MLTICSSSCTLKLCHLTLTYGVADQRCLVPFAIDARRLDGSVSCLRSLWPAPNVLHAWLGSVWLLHCRCGCCFDLAHRAPPPLLPQRASRYLAFVTPAHSAISMIQKPQQRRELSKRCARRFMTFPNRDRSAAAHGPYLRRRQLRLLYLLGACSLPRYYATRR